MTINPSGVNLPAPPYFGPHIGWGRCTYHARLDPEPTEPKTGAGTAQSMSTAVRDEVAVCCQSALAAHGQKLMDADSAALRPRRRLVRPLPGATVAVHRAQFGRASG
jgi:hypothetical protein